MEEKSTEDKMLDMLLVILNATAMIPDVVDVRSLADSEDSIIRDKYADAADSLVTMIPRVASAAPLVREVKRLAAEEQDPINTFLKEFPSLLKTLGLKKVKNGANTIVGDPSVLISRYKADLDKLLKRMICDKLKWACFAKGTLVYTSAGYIPIEEICIGDMVYSKNPDTGEEDVKRILDVYMRDTRILYHLTFGNEIIHTTREHPFWVYGKGLVAADELQAGDAVVTYGGGEASSAILLTNIRKELSEDNISVYNLSIESWHTYFVGENRLLVHNVEYTGVGRIGKAKRAESDGVADAFEVGVGVNQPTAGAAIAVLPPLIGAAAEAAAAIAAVAGTIAVAVEGGKVLEKVKSKKITIATKTVKHAQIKGKPKVKEETEDKGGSGSNGNSGKKPNNWNHRDKYLKIAQNSLFVNAIDQLFRKGAYTGDGGTADILIHEFLSGKPLKHLQKARDMIDYLNRIIANEILNAEEKKLAYKLVDELYKAVKMVTKNIK